MFPAPPLPLGIQGSSLDFELIPYILLLLSHWRNANPGEYESPPTLTSPPSNLYPDTYTPSYPYPSPHKTYPTTFKPKPKPKTHRILSHLPHATLSLPCRPPAKTSRHKLSTLLSLTRHFSHQPYISQRQGRERGHH